MHATQTKMLSQPCLYSLPQVPRSTWKKEESAEKSGRRNKRSPKRRRGKLLPLNCWGTGNWRNTRSPREAKMEGRSDKVDDSEKAEVANRCSVTLFWLLLGGKWRLFFSFLCPKECLHFFFWLDLLFPRVLFVPPCNKCDSFKLKLVKLWRKYSFYNAEEGEWKWLWPLWPLELLKVQGTYTCLQLKTATDDALCTQPVCCHSLTEVKLKFWQ